ncbi:MAG: TRAP transporter substrate-binding protein DctP [Alphaproteobacteria bacterium]|jgi:TRAP-type C4-dicarboxylate transport system substrate-binding protein|nr:TRAP transporter substrate-binding protein DctP [Alphaproteobacteria bacterium]
MAKGLRTFMPRMAGGLIMAVPAVIAMAGTLTGPAAAEAELRAVSMFPRGLVYTQSFLGLVEQVNARGRGLVQIRFIGGPEAVPTTQQAEALRTGVVDMIYGPGSYYPGLVPETDALIGSNISPMEQRRNGGIALLNSIHERKMNGHYLAHIDGGVSFHIYLKEPPGKSSDGGIDLNGLKLRAGPFYREFFTALGAVHVLIPAPEVYTALSRGAVDGIGWPSIGIMDFSWDQFLKVRIDPGFSQTDLGVLVNLDRWTALDPAARDLLESVAVAYEAESYQRSQALAASEDAELRARGMDVITLDAAAAQAYLATAYRSIWQRLESRDDTHYQALRALFYRE